MILCRQIPGFRKDVYKRQAEAFELGLKLAREVDADIVLATDPDADRLGVRVKDRNGEYHDLTGNMSGCLLANYELSQRKAVNGSLPEDGALVKTIVTTKMCIRDSTCTQRGSYLCSQKL